MSGFNDRFLATRYELKEDFNSHKSGRVTFDRTNSFDYAGDKWAIRTMGECLNKNGEWEYEPSPSNRDFDFYKRCRFDSLLDAIAAYDRISNKKK